MQPFIRGYAAVGLRRPKTPTNIGSALRAINCFGGKLFVFDGRVPKGSWCTDTQGTRYHLPMLHVDDVYEMIPYDCVPVGVEICEGSRDLTTYKHPLRAFYIFGNEANGLAAKDLKRCREVIQIPSLYCLNLAAAVNVVLYDRMVKSKRDWGTFMAPRNSLDRAAGTRVPFAVQEGAPDELR